MHSKHNKKQREIEIHGFLQLSSQQLTNNVTGACDGQDASGSQHYASTIKAKATFQQPTELLRATRSYGHFTKDNFIRNSYKGLLGMRQL